MHALETPGMVIFILVLCIGVYSTIFGFPGTIIVLVSVAVAAVVMEFAVVELKHVVVMAILSLAIETAGGLIDFVQARKPPLSLAGIAAALVGSGIGAVMLMPFLLGPGILLGMFLGGFAGLMAMQMIEQRKVKPAFRERAGDRLLRCLTVVGRGAAAMGMTAFVLVRVYS